MSRVEEGSALERSGSETQECRQRSDGERWLCRRMCFCPNQCGARANHAVGGVGGGVGGRGGGEHECGEDAGAKRGDEDSG
jgi:hypothetical protein